MEKEKKVHLFDKKMKIGFAKKTRSVWCNRHRFTRFPDFRRFTPVFRLFSRFWRPGFSCCLVRFTVQSIEPTGPVLKTLTSPKPYTNK